MLWKTIRKSSWTTPFGFGRQVPPLREANADVDVVRSQTGRRASHRPPGLRLQEDPRFGVALAGLPIDLPSSGGRGQEHDEARSREDGKISEWHP